MKRTLLVLFCTLYAFVASGIAIGQDFAIEKSLQNAVENKAAFAVLKRDTTSVAYFLGFLEGRYRLTLDNDIRQSLQHWAVEKSMFGPLSRRKELCSQNATTFLTKGTLPLVNEVIGRDKLQLTEMISPAVEVKVEGENVYCLGYSFVGEAVIIKKFSIAGRLIWKKDIGDRRDFLGGARRLVAGLASNGHSVFVISIYDNDLFDIEEIDKTDGSQTEFLHVKLES